MQKVKGNLTSIWSTVVNGQMKSLDFKMDERCGEAKIIKNCESNSNLWKEEALILKGEALNQIQIWYNQIQFMFWETVRYQRGENFYFEKLLLSLHQCKYNLDFQWLDQGIKVPVGWSYSY